MVGMPRPPRLDAAGAIHHVMNRGVARQRTFFGDVDRVEFGIRLAAIHERFGVETLAYCLMTNHYHLLVRTPGGGLPAAMQHLGLVYTRHTNERVGRDGPLFRGRYHSILVTTDDYLVAASRYIHRNPLDIPGVSSPAQYRWSSYRSYLGHRRTPQFLCTDVVLAQFDHDVGRLARHTETADRNGGGAISSVADLMQWVELCVARDDIANGDDQARRWIGRTVLVLLTELLPTGSLRTQLAQSLVFPTTDARAAAVRRACLRRTDPVVARVLDLVLDGLGTGLSAA